MRLIEAREVRSQMSIRSDSEYWGQDYRGGVFGREWGQGRTPVGDFGIIDEVLQKLKDFFLEMCSKFLVILAYINNVKNKNMEERNNIVPNIVVGRRLPRLPGQQT